MLTARLGSDRRSPSKEAVSPVGDERRLRLPNAPEARRVAPLKMLPMLVVPKASIMDGVTLDRGRPVGVESILDCFTVLVDSAVDMEDLARRGGPGRRVAVGATAGLFSDKTGRDSK